MKIAKVFVALLFSFTLVAGQFSFANPVETKQPKKCCTKRCCCSKPSESNSTPSPLVPPQTTSQLDGQLVASVAQHIVSAIAPVKQPRASSQPFLLSSSTVPLYERHCSFLI